MRAALIAILLALVELALLSSARSAEAQCSSYTKRRWEYYPPAAPCTNCAYRVRIWKDFFLCNNDQPTLPYSTDIGAAGQIYCPCNASDALTMSRNPNAT